MKTLLLLSGLAILMGTGNLAPCAAQTPAHLPPPVIVAPKPQVPKTPAPEPAVAAPAKPKNVWCPACRGRKTVGVEAELTCKTCAGTGKLKSGFGKVESDCTFCKGTGKVTGLVQEPCPVCKAKGILEGAVFEQFITCTNCSGSKLIETNLVSKCTTCNGAGKIVKSSISSGGSFGKGKSSGASATVAQEQPCPFCGATGTVEKKTRVACPLCYGAGVVPPPPPPPPAPKDG